MKDIMIGGFLMKNLETYIFLNYLILIDNLK